MSDLYVSRDATFSSGYFSQKGIYIFLLIVLANYILIWLSRNLLIDENVFYNTFSEQLTYARSMSLFENMKRFSWITYAFYPVILLVKTTLISIVLFLGIFFISINDKVAFCSVFKVVLIAESVFILPGLIKFIWFYFFVNGYTINDLEFFYPLSLINFFKRSEVLKVWVYPLQTVNVFHLIYILLISVGLNKVCLIGKSDSEKIMLWSYPPVVILWNVLIMFLLIDN
jgi:hypothetical protein